MVRPGAPACGVSPSPAGLQGVGPKKQGLSLSLVSPSGTWAGARGPGTVPPAPKGFLCATPPGPSPTAVGSAVLGAAPWPPPGARGRGGVFAEPGTRQLFLFCPFLRVGLGT